jgi:hypothetical protein
MEEDAHRSFGGKFADAAWDLGRNIKAVWEGHATDWHGISVFYSEIFYPYMVGGVLPGAFFGTVCYYISVPLIRAYQQRRKGTIKAKFEALKAKAAVKAEAKRKAEDSASSND